MKGIAFKLVLVSVTTQIQPVDLPDLHVNWVICCENSEIYSFSEREFLMYIFTVPLPEVLISLFCLVS